MKGFPPTDDDPIMRLIVHYFEPAELMYENYRKLNSEWNRKKNYLPPKPAILLFSYSFGCLHYSCLPKDSATRKSRIISSHG